MLFGSFDCRRSSCNITGKQMTDWIEWDPAYSTTRRVRNVAPEVVEAELKAVQKSEDQFKTILFLPEGEGRKGEGGLRTKGYYKKSTDDNPLITVITVVYNGEQHLEETILSVINQTYDNVEYIIIDGGSIDGTLNIIQKYEHAIDYWVSEKDNGIYCAMNKGIDLAMGEFVGFVNSDDFLYEEILSELGNMEKSDEFDFTLGDVNIYSQCSKYQETNIHSEEIILNKKYIFHMPTHHLGFYVRKRILKKVGKFNTDYKLRADFDLLSRVIDSTKSFLILKNRVGGFRLGGVSGSYATFIENNKILKNRNVGIFRRALNIIPSMLKIFIVDNAPKPIVRWLRNKFGSGRYIAK